MNSKILILLILFSLVACKQRNKLITDEQKLAAEILQQEQEKEALKSEKGSSATSGSGSAVLRLEENRSVDPNHPPLILDIPGSRNKIKQVKYSELGNSIRYIFLQQPGDSAFFKYSVKILFTKSNIIATTWKGIARFDLQGHFIEMICNDGQKAIFDEKSNTAYSTTELMNQYIGSQGTVSAIGDKIFYKYVNNPNEEAFLMEYDVTPGKQTLMMPGQNEKTGMNGKGEILATLPSERRGGDITILDEDHWFTGQHKFQSSKTGFFLTVHSLSGDTVCTLKDNDPVTNFSSSVYRGVEDGDNYKFNGQRYLRQNFNDTIYRFESTNRLVPVYVIHLGEKGVASSEEAITPKFDLKDKFVYNNIVETQGFLFFLYTQDYSCPNTAKSGTLKYNRFMLNKETGEQFHAYVDEAPFIPEGKIVWPGPPQKNIINDLDFGPAQWPNQQTENGQIYFQISGKDLKEHVRKNQSGSNNTNKEKLEQLAKNCSDDDVLLMIIE